MRDLRSMPRAARRYAWRRLFVAGCAVWALTGSTTQTPPMTPMPPHVRAELAPHGRLRAALNHSNFLLVSKPAPAAEGVAPDLARELARRAGATVEFVGYANAGLVADASKDQAWDVAFIGAEPERAAYITFTPAYVEIEATYLVRGDSPIRTMADVDRDGVRVVSAARAAYTLFLQRTLGHATVVEATGIDGSFEAFTRGGVDALAGLKPRLLDDVKKVPGARLLDGRFTAVQQSMAVPRARTEAAAYLEAFAREIRTSGFLASLIEKHGAHGLTIAR